MKKKIAILGSTGSIGKSLLNIIKKDKSNFEIILLTADRNYKELINQTKVFKVKNVIITNKNSYDNFKRINKNLNIKIYNSFNKIDFIFRRKIDYVMSSIVGLSGLKPTLNIIRFTKKIAIANKESIICGWNLIKKELNKHKTVFIPIDSEHFSISYALNNNYTNNISQIYLTASGGPLLKLPFKKIKNIKINEVLKHPTWSMGKKISVDSSTMMNKVFEVIEAKNIFNIPIKNLNILIHPQSYIHSIVCFNDGMIKLIAHETTMEIPIFNSIYQNQNKNYFKNQNFINIKQLNNLNFKDNDKKKFPLLNLLQRIPEKISLYETVLVSANDELVQMFLDKKIDYIDISQLLIKFINRKEFINLKKKKPKNVSEIINLDEYVRLKINPKSV